METLKQPRLTNLEEILVEIYQEIMSWFIDPSARDTLLGRKIIVNGNLVKINKTDVHSMFLHLASFDNPGKYNVLPCANTLEHNLCVSIKDNCSVSSRIFELRKTDRYECLYRMLRIKQLFATISNYNTNPEVLVKYYEKVDKDNSGKKYTKAYLLWEQDGEQYLVVFRKDKDKAGHDIYILISAFPLVYKPSIEETMRDLLKYKNKNRV